MRSRQKFFKIVRTQRIKIFYCNNNGERIEKLSQQDELRIFCMDAFLNVVEIGQYIMTKDTGDFTQFNTVACREYSLPREEEDAPQPRGCIQGNTKIGPVLEVTISYMHGKHEVENIIISWSRDNTHSWVRISHGSNKFVMDSNNNDTVPGDQLEEHVLQLGVLSDAVLHSIGVFTHVRPRDPWNIRTNSNASPPTRLRRPTKKAARKTRSCAFTPSRNHCAMILQLAQSLQNMCVMARVTTLLITSSADCLRSAVMRPIVIVWITASRTPVKLFAILKNNFESLGSSKRKHRSSVVTPDGPPAAPLLAVFIVLLQPKLIQCKWS